MDLARLIAQSNRYGLESLTNGRTLPGLAILRTETVSAIDAVVYEPIICPILQGRKEAWIGDQFADLGPW